MKVINKDKLIELFNQGLDTEQQEELENLTNKINTDFIIAARGGDDTITFNAKGVCSKVKSALFNKLRDAGISIWDNKKKNEYMLHFSLINEY